MIWEDLGGEMISDDVEPDPELLADIDIREKTWDQIEIP